MGTETHPFIVVGHHPFGLLVRLEDGRTGVIRVRETSWNSEDRQNWQELFPVNWESRAVVIREDSEELELSLRRAQNDPWDEVPGRYKRGQVVKGIVTGVMTYGAFVEISKGITGLLHVSELPDAVEQGPMELFWPGDYILVKLLKINLRRRRISLGLARPPLKPPAVGDNEVTVLTASTEAVRQSTFKGLLQDTQFHKRVLVVEDEPRQAKAMATWLRNLGQRVDVVHTGEEGLHLIEADPPDIVVADLGLPGISGLEVLKIVLRDWPGIQCALVTDMARADEFRDEIYNLEAENVQFMQKPLQPEDLMDLFIRPAQSQSRERQSNQQVVFGDGFSLNELSDQSLKKSLKTLLEKCRELLSFDSAVLFVLNTANRNVDVMASAGMKAENEKALSQLVHSPVRDCAEDGDIIAIEDLKPQDEGRFRYLLEYYALEACLGVPIPVQGTKKYAAMVFHRSPQVIGSETMLLMQAVALAIGALLEQSVFQEKMITIQRTALLGNLTRGLIHEINNRIGGLQISLNDLESSLNKQAALVSTSENDEVDLQDAIKYALEINEDVNSITKTVRQFGRFAKRPKTEFLRLDEIIQTAMDILEDARGDANVEISVVYPESMVVIRSQGTALEQVFTNLLLNAIQQIAACSYCKGGWIQVRFDVVDEPGDTHLYRIMVEDSGPGIHASQWEEIFDLGFTTREEGTGMGLYISRSLVQTLGGNLYVRESCILGGTMFALELPYGL
jgi:signal transduction histidine kinase/DNA-binding response OmpR family regulator/predicted RNA-binding protein with RPS1 domain